MGKGVSAALLAIAFVAASVKADDPAAQCSQDSGQYLTGTVISAPHFAHGHQQRGVELSHTQINIRGADGQTYQVAMDNVFASGYAPGNSQVPAPLSSIKVGVQIELCGIRYNDPPGIHWVHTNCGDTPTAADPNGWVKVVGAGGTPGPNLESSGKYCSIFHQ